MIGKIWEDQRNRSRNRKNKELNKTLALVIIILILIFLYIIDFDLSIFYNNWYMADIIKILPTEVSNKIAARVVQRPASVVKELLENSIDAKSTKIKLVIKDSGRH